jgi:hypothetical protein
MDNLNNHTERENELKEMPTLRSMPSSNFFDAPDGYFDTLSSQIQDRIKASKENTYFIPIFRPAVAGFSFAFMIICFALVYFNGNENQNYNQQADLSTPSFETIIESGYYIDLEEALIAETLCEISVTNDTTQLSPQDLELENYLIQSMNETTLLNEL